ncbi:unnamed protein product [Bursaphelenchus okinawaensis]|uniref:Uncharacterized protein n=1 Tax=Bursaphelenchus okinawaensis TaxID=465554 RepID=A0A811KQ76_9BILA|nr:unnamed protein product [Bursaphelenchus okinawaensis]CAG9110081.1 unnamed protein product [Bursaphelenchus okinawaensis]
MEPCSSSHSTESDVQAENRLHNVQNMTDYEMFYFREIYLINPGKFRKPMKRSSLASSWRHLTDQEFDTHLDHEIFEITQQYVPIPTPFKFDTDYDLPVHGEFGIVIGGGWPADLYMGHCRIFGFKTFTECMCKLKNVNQFTRCYIFIQRYLYDRRVAPHGHYYEYCENEERLTKPFYELELRRFNEVLADLDLKRSDGSHIVVVQFPLELDDRQQTFNMNNVRHVCAKYKDVAHMFEFVNGEKGEIYNEEEVNRRLKKAISRVVTTPNEVLKEMSQALRTIVQEFGTKQEFEDRLRDLNAEKKHFLIPKMMSVRPPGFGPEVHRQQGPGEKVNSWLNRQNQQISRLNGPLPGLVGQVGGSIGQGVQVKSENGFNNRSSGQELVDRTLIQSPRDQIVHPTTDPGPMFTLGLKSMVQRVFSAPSQQNSHHDVNFGNNGQHDTFFGKSGQHDQFSRSISRNGHTADHNDRINAPPLPNAPYRKSLGQFAHHDTISGKTGHNDAIFGKISHQASLPGLIDTSSGSNGHNDRIFGNNSHHDMNCGKSGHNDTSFGTNGSNGQLNTTHAPAPLLRPNSRNQDNLGNFFPIANGHVPRLPPPYDPYQQQHASPYFRPGGRHEIRAALPRYEPPRNNIRQPVLLYPPPQVPLLFPIRFAPPPPPLYPSQFVGRGRPRNRKPNRGMKGQKPRGPYF